MIEREITLPDGRIFRYHLHGETTVYSEAHQIYVLTKSYETENTIDYVILRAIVDFEEFDPALLADPDSIIASYELKLYIGFEEHSQETVETLKEAKRKEINAERDRLEKSGFPYMNKQIDSDMQSVSRITVASQSAMVALQVGVPFSITWTCADNSTLDLDAEGMLGMSPALATHAETLHYRAKDLKDQVDSITATDLEEVRELLADIPIS